MKEQIKENTTEKSSVGGSKLDQQTTIEGTPTSRIETKNKAGETYYYGFFKLETQDQEIPIVFKSKPDLKKGSQVKLTGKWSQSNGNRPSFTCSDFKIITGPPEVTTKTLQKQIQPLLSAAWEQRKSWIQTTEFLTKKQEQLRELERYQKYPHLLQAYLDLKAFYYSNEYYQQELSWNHQAFLAKIASELENTEKKIKALQNKETANKALDTLAHNSIEILSQALTEKDQIIQELQQKLAREVNHE